LNIRVLNLSFGTNSTQPYVQDPLAYAAEQAWKHGIVVAVAAGNDGSSTTTSLADPAYDPYLLAVGASDPNGTVSPSNDTVAPFANHGTAGRPVDLVAPGVHVLGLRAPDSSLDVAYPTARVGTRFFRGSGTSQATALVSGAAAVLLQKFPAATPDQIKNLLQMSAYNFSAPANYRGAGSVDLAAAIARKLSTNGQGNTGGSTGDGSLDLSRGDSFVNDGTADLRGEVDIFGTPFSSAAIAAAETSASSWTGATWNGNDWTGVDWTGTGGSWAGRTWTGRTWTGRTWTGRTWTGRTWTGRTWTSASWS
jgi:serine protease AprX